MKSAGNGQWHKDQTGVKGKVRDFSMVTFSGGDRPQVKLDNAVFKNISDEDNGICW